jgi:hypothetical protein
VLVDWVTDEFARSASIQNKTGLPHPAVRASAVRKRPAARADDLADPLAAA